MAVSVALGATAKTDTTRMHTDKRHVVGASAVFVLLFFISLIIGGFGPNIWVVHDGGGFGGGSTDGHEFDVYAAENNDNIWFGSLNSMVAEHQILFVETSVKRPTVWGNNQDTKTFQLVYVVSAKGYGRVRGIGADAKTDDDTAHELLDTRRYVHEVTCLGKEEWCEPSVLMTQHVVVFEKYEIMVAIQNPKESYPAAATESILTTKVRFRFVNREYTSFTLGWYYTCLTISLFVLLCPGAGFVARLPRDESWSFDQRWALALCVGLILLLDYPLAAAEVFATSKLASTAITAVYIFSAYAFAGGLLCYFLFVIRDVRTADRDRRHHVTPLALLQALLCASIAHLGATCMLARRLADAENGAGGAQVLEVEQVGLVICVFFYVSWFLYEFCKAVPMLRLMQSYEVVLAFLTLFVMVVTLAAIFVQGFDALAVPVPVVFVTCIAVPNLYVWALCYLFSPISTPKIQGAMTRMWTPGLSQRDHETHNVL
ncbi:Wnt-binding factor required for Wnt secretion-domain-containing protein [Pelagophyceae sp. CCMP2097]|nr:Wnt-binding factor required for Wnt secretion-domain-containing protein [Pelagophyceae sp. CCMP2097]